MIVKLKAVCVTAAIALAPITSAAQEARDVVTEHLRGFGALDAEAMAAPFAESAKIITTDGIYSGTEEIRAFMDNLVAEFSQPGIAMETHDMAFDGDVVMITWSAESPGKIYEFGVDTFRVEDGRIVLHTTAAQVTPK